MDLCGFGERNKINIGFDALGAFDAAMVACVGFRIQQSPVVVGRPGFCRVMGKAALRALPT